MKRGLQDNKRAVGIVVGLYSLRLGLGGREAGRSSSVQRQLGLHSETLYQREKKRGREGERGRRGGGGENGEGGRRRRGKENRRRGERK